MAEPLPPGFWQDLRRFASPDLSAGNIMGSIDYSQPLPRAPYGGQVGASAGPAYNPIANWLAAQSMQPGIWQNLAAFAQPMDRMERGARGVVGMAGEATGLPAAARAGEAAAAGNIPQAVGEGLQALPSRVGSIVGFPLASAEAQAPDPRAVRVQKLDRDIAGHRKTLQELGTQNFRSTVARNNASKPYLDAIGSAQTERDRLQGEINAEFKAARDAQLAAERSADWERTPLQKRYPGLLPTTAATGVGVGAAVGGLFGRRIGNYNRNIGNIERQWGEAVARAQNTRLAADKRKAAATEANELQRRFDAMQTEGPRFSTWTPAGTMFAGAELGMAAPNIANYAMGIPGSGEAFMDPMTYARMVGVGVPAAAAGKLLGSGFKAFQAEPTGHHAATAALPKTFRAPRKR